MFKKYKKEDLMRAWFSFALLSLVLVLPGCVSSGVQRRDMKRVVQASAVAPSGEEDQSRGITVSAIFYDYFYRSLVFNVTVTNESEGLLEVDPSKFHAVIDKALSSSLEGKRFPALESDERSQKIYGPLRKIALRNPYAESGFEQAGDFLDLATGIVKAIRGEEDEEWEEQMEKEEERKYRKKMLYYEWEKANRDREEKFDIMVKDMESKTLTKCVLQKGESAKGFVFFQLFPEAEKFSLVFPIEGKEWSGRFWQLRMF